MNCFFHILKPFTRFRKLVERETTKLERKSSAFNFCGQKDKVFSAQIICGAFLWCGGCAEAQKERFQLGGRKGADLGTLGSLGYWTGDDNHWKKSQEIWQVYVGVSRRKFAFLYMKYFLSLKSFIFHRIFFNFIIDWIVWQIFWQVDGMWNIIIILYNNKHYLFNK